MERYNAFQHIIRISHESEDVIQDAATEVARVTADRLGIDGANITFGLGMWKGVLEHSASIEIVTRESTINEDITLIRNHVVAMGLTAYVTVVELTAFELY